MNAFLDGWNLCNSLCHADVNQLQVSSCLLLCFNHSFAFRFIYPFNVCKSSIFLHSLPHTLLVEAERSERVQLVHVFYVCSVLVHAATANCGRLLLNRQYCRAAYSLLCGTLRDELGEMCFIFLFTRMQQYLELFESEVEHFPGWFFMPSRSSLLLCREMARSIYGECAMYEYIYLDHQTLFLRGWVSQSAIGGPSM